MTLDQLARTWQAEAQQLRTRYGMDQLATLAETHAAELLEAMREANDQQLTLSEAASESGYSVRRLRELIAEGRIPNAGRKGAPRIRRADVPRRAGQPSQDTFDPRAHAAGVS